jgi:hypothetical protein
VIVILPGSLTRKELKKLLFEDIPASAGRPWIITSGRFEMFPSYCLYTVLVEKGAEMDYVGVMKRRGLVAYGQKQKRYPATYRKTHVRLRH